MTLSKNLFRAIIFMIGTGLVACKGKTDNSTTTTNTDTTTNSTTNNTPVVVESDDALKTGVKDATKDFADVKATVENGEITLTGEISRDRLPVLIQSLNSLHPKKINNNLTIK